MLCKAPRHSKILYHPARGPILTSRIEQMYLGMRQSPTPSRRRFEACIQRCIIEHLRTILLSTGPEHDRQLINTRSGLSCISPLSSLLPGARQSQSIPRLRDFEMHSFLSLTVMDLIPRLVRSRHSFSTIQIRPISAVDCHGYTIPSVSNLYRLCLVVNVNISHLSQRVGAMDLSVEVDLV